MPYRAGLSSILITRMGRAALAALLVCLFGGGALAQERGFRVHRYEGATVGSSLFLVQRPWYSRTRFFALGVTVEGSLGALTPRIATGRGPLTPVLSSALLGHAELAVSLFDRVLLGASLPVSFLEAGTSELVSGAAPLSNVGVGDPRASLMVRLAGEAEVDPVSLHLGADAWVPLGLQATGQGDSGFRVMPRAVLAGAAGVTRWTLELAYLHRPYASIGPPALGMIAAPEARAGFAFGLSLLGDRLTLGPEALLAMQVQGDDAFTPNGMSLELLGGVKYLIGEQVQLGLAGGTAFFGMAGTPDARAMVKLAWAPRRDTDDDGVPNLWDACPDAPGPEHAEATKRGCLDPASLDADLDGVPDGPDRCPFEPESINGLRDADGCPEYGIPADSRLAWVLLMDALSARKSAAEPATQRSVAERERAAAATQKSAAEAEKSAAEREKSVAAAEKSAAEREKAAAAAQKSAAEAEKSAAEAEKAASEAEKSAAEREKSAAEAEKSAAERMKSASEREKSAAAAEKSAAEREKSAAAAEKSAAEAQKSTAPPTDAPLAVALAKAVAPSDLDGDTVLDEADRCPMEPEDRDAFEDEDGCPELDNDQDAIADAMDRCPDEAEALNGIDDEDGCPDVAPDQDQDGVADAVDRCPLEPESPDGLRDEDGCPEFPVTAQAALAKILAPPTPLILQPATETPTSAEPPAPPDADADGVFDDDDRCPVTAEDRDGFEDEDGCPELDDDADGVPDAKDRCADAAETVNAWQDDDGCPEEHPDADGDGLGYAADRCPLEASDSTDGCPHAPPPALSLPHFPLARAAANAPAAPATEATTAPAADLDRDGTPDDADACPMTKEDLDGFEDEDGCPEPDNDRDGIDDAKDKCPLVAENINGTKDDDGCPDSGAGLVHVVGNQVVVDEVVRFKPGSATLEASANKLLKQVAGTLRAASTLSVEIQGHTDDTGSAATNIKLSQRRAETIKAFLVKAGVAANRLVPRGYGPTRPRATNTTPAGREQNRRVEFLILGEAK